MTRQTHHRRAGLVASLPASSSVTGLALRGVGCAAAAMIVVLGCSLTAAHADVSPPTAPTEVAVTPTGHVSWVDGSTSAEVPVTAHRIIDKQESNDAAALVDTTVSADSYDLPQTDGYEHLVCVSALSGAAEGSATCVTHQSYVTPDQITITGTGYMRHGQFFLAASGVNSFGGPGGHYVTTVDGAPVDLQMGADGLGNNGFDLQYLSLGLHDITVSVANNAYATTPIAVRVDVQPPKSVPGNFTYVTSNASAAVGLSWQVMDTGGGPTTVHARLDDQPEVSADRNDLYMRIPVGTDAAPVVVDGRATQRASGTHLLTVWAQNARGSSHVFQSLVRHGSGPNSPYQPAYDSRSGRLTWSAYGNGAPTAPTPDSASVFIDGVAVASGLSPDLHSYSLTHLGAGVHVIEVAFGAGGALSYSEPLLVTQTAPRIASLTVSRPLRDHTLRVAWQDPRPSATSADVLTVTDGARTLVHRSYTPGSHHITLTGLPGGRHLIVRVAATNPAGTSSRARAGTPWKAVPTALTLIGSSSRTVSANRIQHVHLRLSYGITGDRHSLPGDVYTVYIRQAGHWDWLPDGTTKSGGLINLTLQPGQYRVVVPTHLVDGTWYAATARQFTLHLR